MSKGVRFAPSPTGRFHLGNLRTAWVSFQWAKYLGEPWIVRFEDIDGPRSISGAKESQIEDMGKIGLHAQEIVIQSENHPRHEALFRRAAQARQIYPCSCSRKTVKDALQNMASAPHGPTPVYDGHCRQLPPEDVKPGTSLGWRFRSEDESGARDFIVGRASLEGMGFLPSYHWACAIDDYDGGYRLLVRAYDLLDACEPQRAIQSWISRDGGRTQPFSATFHSALILLDATHRLEKRTHGATLEDGWLRSSQKARDLIQAFELSFRNELRDFEEGEIFGERHRSLTLQALGLAL